MILLALVGLDIAFAKRLDEGEVAVAEELSISIPRIHGDSVRSPFFGGSAEVVLQTPRGVRLPSALTVNHREVGPSNTRPSPDSLPSILERPMQKVTYAGGPQSSRPPVHTGGPQTTVAPKRPPLQRRPPHGKGST